MRHLFRLVSINFTLARFGLDQIVLSIHFFRPLYMLGMINPFNWFRSKHLSQAIEHDPEMIQVGLFELIDAFQRILLKVSKDHVVEMESDEISVKDRINEILGVIEEKGSITFTELFDTAVVEKRFIVVTFLSLLELMKMNLIRVAQSTQNGLIRLFYQ